MTLFCQCFYKFNIYIMIASMPVDSIYRGSYVNTQLAYEVKRHSTA